MRRPVSMVTEPNMVPMIDVLLVLLIIFFLAAAVMARKAFDLQLPDPAARGSGEPPLVLTVHPGPRYELNGMVLGTATLGAQIGRVLAPRPEKVLFVKASPRLRYQEVVHVFDVVRGAGVKVTAIVPGAR